MYQILNRTTNKVTIVKGDWPYDLVTELLNKDNDIIVISTYSNTVKIPFENNGIDNTNDRDWDWKEYKYL